MKINSYHNHRNKHSHGFTLVELLIVIVVIAILAAISIVAYNGIQTRAHRASIKSQVTQWEKVFKMYTSSTDTRPQGQWVCIGLATDFPADGDFPAGSCAVHSSDGGATWSSLYSVDASGSLLSDQLSEYVSDPSAGHDVVTVRNGMEKWRGIVYDDKSYGHVSLVYVTPGDSCVTDAWIRFYVGKGYECYYSIMRVSDVPTIAW